jgi:predicted Zn-dependent protease
MYTRDQAKAIVDKVLDMAGGDAQVTLTGGERSGTRWANSSITTNLVQYDRQLSLSVRLGNRVGTATTRDFSDAGLREMVDEAQSEARQASENFSLPELLGPQQYIPVPESSANVVDYGPAERARMVKASLDLCETKGVVGAGYIPKNDQTNCTANTKGLFAYFRNAETSFILTCRMPDGSGSGWAGATGLKDIGQLDPVALTEVAANKALMSRNARAIEPGRYTVILEPRANARFLSLLTSVFTSGGGPGGGGAAEAGAGGGGGAAGLQTQGNFMANRKVGDQLFSDTFNLKSDIGNPVLRQSTIMPTFEPAKPVTWVENGVLKSFGPNQGATPSMSLHMPGTDLSVEDMIKQTRRGLLVTFFWYIRGVPSEVQPLLNTGMTRDGLFLIENGEIVGPVQNFRWNMSPIVGYNNLSLVGKPVPMHMGESYDGAGTALIPPVRMEEFYMTSVSPAL